MNEPLSFPKPRGEESGKRRKTMKCPNCGNRTSVEIDIHSEGFTAEESPVKECGECGLVWRVRVVKGKTEVDVIKAGKAKG